MACPRQIAQLKSTYWAFSQESQLSIIFELRLECGKRREPNNHPSPQPSSNERVSESCICRVVDSSASLLPTITATKGLTRSVMKTVHAGSSPPTFFLFWLFGVRRSKKSQFLLVRQTAAEEQTAMKCARQRGKSEECIPYEHERREKKKN